MVSLDGCSIISPVKLCEVCERSCLHPQQLPPWICPSFFSEARRISGRLPATVCKRIGASVCVWIWKVVIIAGVWPVYEFVYCMNCVEGNLTGQLNNTTQKKLYFLVFKLDIISHFYKSARSPMHLCLFFSIFWMKMDIYTTIKKFGVSKVFLMKLILLLSKAMLSWSKRTV